LLQQWQHVQAQEIAVGLVAGIAGVVNPVQRLRLRIGQQRGARNLQQRAPHRTGGKRRLAADCGQPIHPGPAQGAQQEGFGLVVAVMGQGQLFARAQGAGERIAAGMARGRFQAVAAVAGHVDADHLQVDVPGRADRLAMLRPRVGSRLQAMVHVHRTQAGIALRSRLRQPMQQHGGIESTTEAHQDRAGGSGEMGQGRGHRFGQAQAGRQYRRCGPGSPRTAVRGWSVRARGCPGD
jgi:hypothetical protein